MNLHENKKLCIQEKNKKWTANVGRHIRASPADVELYPLDDALERIEAFHSPKSKKELMSFLGQVCNISDFFPTFATLGEPLTGLLKKDVHYHWSDDSGLEFYEEDMPP
ncbi:unnamed protein product [Ambrosiozyma monospora]|uniref:Unnamed protein product n=1 Tax=Ambrosiozyma monospora TaxID=43982 RepID=A0A9W6YSM9_AMBMO|nr:unnamed protein product [Ambrosiozyma monospora]